MHMRIIETEEDIAEGAACLARLEPRFGDVLAQTGPWPLRRRADGFGALRDAILGQQVSVASANAIRLRLEAAGLGGRRALAIAAPEDLRACGFSRQKIRYIQALAQSDIDFTRLRSCSDAAIFDQLLPLPGIGRWTVEMYLMFALGRADIFAADDLALAEAARMLFDLPERPKPRAFREMAAAWAPWRSVAARGLWAYYAYSKKREGVSP
ncbi:DNA-3-methyladenine glycosylase 2 family protein [Thioclava sp. GXIMD4216]|uniref:DNA-3-methyladenine glycosylase II n=1 Tax=Thioclava litoralis TaxID=3076557 RepID=A0ABZ1E4K7_9RHOB|nr:DNA-3-methyladenine glycosylase 2 family protein [Thioclava sp. FTW29]